MLQLGTRSAWQHLGARRLADGVVRPRRGVRCRAGTRLRLNTVDALAGASTPGTAIACALLANIGLLVFLVAVHGRLDRPAVVGRGTCSPCSSPSGCSSTRRGRQALQVAMVGISTLEGSVGRLGGDRGRHRRRGRRAGRPAGHGRGLQPDDPSARAPQRHRARAARRLGIGDLVQPRSRTASCRSPRRAGIVRDAKGEPLASDELVAGRQRAAEGRLCKASGAACRFAVSASTAWAVRPQVKVVEGQALHARLARARGRPRRAAAIRGAGDRQGDPARRQHVEGRRRLRLGRRARIGALERCRLSSPTPIGAAKCPSSSVTVRLPDAKAVDAFKAALAANPQLKVDAIDHRSSTTGKQSEGITKIIRGHRHRRRHDHGDRRHVRCAQTRCSRPLRTACARDRDAARHRLFRGCPWWWP